MVAEFSLEFQAIALGLQWHDDCLKILYGRTLNPEPWDEFIARGGARSFEDYVTLSMMLDNMVKE